MHKFFFGILIAVVMVFVPSAVSASSEPAVVFHGDSCTIAGFGGSYVGHTTVIIKGGDLKHYSCNAALVGGAAVDKLVQFWSGEGHWVFTPGGQASVVYARGF